MPAGRPSKLDDYKDILAKMARYGLTDKQMADVIGITEQTLNNWKSKDEQFFESLKSAKELADIEVVESLLHRAKGYSHQEDKIFLDNGKPVIVPTIKHYPPDTTAMIFWLKNRQSAKWRDKQDIESTVNNTHSFSNLSTEELKELLGRD
jgi:DNA-binding XRE family transcriptional regulator